MIYNYDESDIVNQIYDSYCENKHNWEHELLQVIYELVIYNDDENLNEIINNYGGIFILCDLYERKYKNTIINEKNLNYYQFLAFIGLYHRIRERLIELIVMNFDILL